MTCRSLRFSHESPYCSRTGVSPENPFLPRRSLHVLSCGFPTSDICTVQSLPVNRVDTQVSPEKELLCTYTHTESYTVEGVPVSSRRDSRIPSSQTSNPEFSVRQFHFFLFLFPWGQEHYPHDPCHGGRPSTVLCV